MNIAYWIGWSLARFISRIFYRMKIMGIENIPTKGSYILASNHISYVDPPFVGSNVSRTIHFMAKKELFKNRLFGKLMSILNAHPVNRRGFDRKAINTALEVLGSGEGLLMFPEGTRSKTDDFLPARPGIGMVARKSGVPIVPAFINGSNKLFLSFIGKKHAAIIYGPPMTPDEIAKYNDDRDGYQQLSDEVLNRIKKLKKEFINKSIKKLN